MRTPAGRHAAATGGVWAALKRDGDKAAEVGSPKCPVTGLASRLPPRRSTASRADRAASGPLADLVGAPPDRQSTSPSTRGAVMPNARRFQTFRASVRAIRRASGAARDQRPSIIPRPHRELTSRPEVGTPVTLMIERRKRHGRNRPNLLHVARVTTCRKRGRVQETAPTAAPRAGARNADRDRCRTAHA